MDNEHTKQIFLCFSYINKSWEAEKKIAMKIDKVFAGVCKNI